MFKLKRVQANVRLGCRGFRVMFVQTEEDLGNVNSESD